MISLTMICKSLMPQARAASTYSASTMLSTVERTSRQLPGTQATVIATIRLTALAPIAATTQSASSVSGIAINISVKRMIMLSVAFPK